MYSVQSVTGQRSVHLARTHTRLRSRVCSDRFVNKTRATLAGWTPEQVAAGRRWIQTWCEAGPELERIRRGELRNLDVRQAIAFLCGPADYTRPPRAPKPTSGLVEQQRSFHTTRP